jgi:zeta-carotene desaturase
MPSVVIVGGGLSGLAAAAALGSAGYDTDLFESRPFLGGRATSYPIGGDDGPVIDNCQHVLLRCCVNLLDFYERLHVADRITFYREFYFVEPGGRVSTIRAGRLPAPAHFAESFVRLRCFTLSEKIALMRGLLRLKRERLRRGDLAQITAAAWLREIGQPDRVIERFWRPVLVSAVNEEIERMAAAHAFQVIWLGFLATVDGYEMGVPAVPLSELYSSCAWAQWPTVRIHLRAAVERVDESGAHTAAGLHSADYYIIAVPFERLSTVSPGMTTPSLEHSPITGIHLWFDRSVTDLPHATLLDRTLQWMFNKDAGRHVQFVVSASRTLVEKSRKEILDLAIQESQEFFPAITRAKLERAHVVKEVRATFSATPDAEPRRPLTDGSNKKVFVAGDWTRTGWPATMEGAIRSGYMAAEAVTAAAGNPHRFLLADIA